MQLKNCEGYFAGVCADFDVELVEMDGERDHVHLLINYPPKLAISNLVNSLKGVSSRLLRRDRPDIAQRDYYKGFFGRRVISRGVVVAHQYPLSASTLSSRETSSWLKTAPYIPDLKDRGFAVTFG